MITGIPNYRSNNLTPNSPGNLTKLEETKPKEKRPKVLLMGPRR